MIVQVDASKIASLVGFPGFPVSLSFGKKTFIKKMAYCK